MKRKLLCYAALALGAWTLGAQAQSTPPIYPRDQSVPLGTASQPAPAVVVQHPAIVERSVEATPAVVVGPPAVRDSSGNPVTSSGGAVQSSATPQVRQGVLVQEKDRVTVPPGSVVVVPQESSSTGASSAPLGR